MSYELKTEKVIARPASDVFNAIKAGRLFMNCSGDSNSMKIDFRVGGRYHIDFKNHGVANFGEFIEIVPDRKVVFSWCQHFGADQKPDTKVTIELIPDGSKTLLKLHHAGFETQELEKQHMGGWTGGLNDLASELEDGRIRMVRNFNAPLAELFKTCVTPETFFAHMGDLSRGSVDFKVGGKYQMPTAKGEIKGEFLEINPNKKILLTWLAGCSGLLANSQVTLVFNEKPDGKSSLELLHDGLLTTDDQIQHRMGWDIVTAGMSESLSSAARS